jgi:hypothetical protein
MRSYLLSASTLLRKYKKVDDSFYAYKLDLSKAYDRVDWFFLEGVLRKLGFDDRWIKWIIACVTSVSYCIKINGQLTKKIFPSTRLRQGDPLSHYLFLFVADGLSELIQRAILREELKEIRICRRAPGISHLLFADDSLMFFKFPSRQLSRSTAGHYELRLQNWECTVL